ncbi:Hydroxyproline dehydrogenase [Blattella germanica]|nr:Hydroxyproline dehydrogenase [Blattella germanica]
MSASITRKMLHEAVLSSCNCCKVHRTYLHTSTSGHSISQQTLQFDDHHTVFRHKNTWELLRALLVLRACGSNFLVDNSLKLLRQGQRVLGNRALGWFLHPTVYSQFVAGYEGYELAVTAEALRKLNVRLMVAPTLEEDVGESSSSQEKYDKNLEEMFRLAEMTHEHGGKQPCLQTKITAMLSADTLMVEKIAAAMARGSAIETLPSINKSDQENINLAVRRLAQLGDIATKKQLRLLVDAEYSYVNPGCSLLTLAMMTVFNQQKPVRAMQTLTHELDILEKLGACFAVKLVRGAYLEKERKMDPTSTCESHSKTGENYQRVLERGLIHALNTGPKRCLLIMATHNEESVRQSILRMQALGLDPKAGHVVFAQIYGMAEQISMPLAQAGYIVYKSVPMGSLDQVLPYLARRAAENRSVLQGARKERILLQRELFWRFRSLLRN